MSDKKLTVLRTRDITHASVLAFSGYVLTKVEREREEMWWSFLDPNGGARAVVMAYINREISGNLKKFVESQRTIKQTLNRR